ncbi:hypothetical protein SELMODRAFT_423306 [Selaginella moellendorffii]|uniref:U2A'/phosphoprotein 32 family A C-terminal domain-containing protein n=1 Tax=Selaginella moellendorffii TaxID=88036 RepID=D8SL88_SELML|nr:hypothetical protein SELMODRAFT_423306 [Selaginella moellendorffii]
MGFDMTPESLKKLCRDLRLYSSCPELNDVLHLQQKGIIEIKSLEKYTGLKTLYLESNDHVSGLDSLRLLETLDLADNQIKTVQGLSCCISLRQLNLSGNRIQSKADVEHLLGCPTLTSLDISKNKIEDEEAIKALRSMPLNLLRLCGNPVMTKIWCYRKSTIACMPSLNYFDDSPVFERERRLAYAWLEGGAEEMIRRARTGAAAEHQQLDDACKIEKETDAWINEGQACKKKRIDLESPAADVGYLKRDYANTDLDDIMSQTTNSSQCDIMDMDIKESPLSLGVSAPCPIKEARNEKDPELEAKVHKQTLRELKSQGAEKERAFKMQLQMKMLERAASGIEETSSLARTTRPVIWGTKAYRQLWTVAKSINSGGATWQFGRLASYGHSMEAMGDIVERPKSSGLPHSKTGGKKKEHVFQRFPTNIDEVAQNAVWREFCKKLDSNEVNVGEFTINPLTTVPITEKPTRVVPSVRGTTPQPPSQKVKVAFDRAISKEEFKDAKQLLEDLYPIKNLDLVPPEKYEVPLTYAQEYGWANMPLVKPKTAFEFPRRTCELTQFAAAYLEAMHTTPFSKKGFVPRYILKQQAALRAADAAATADTTAPAAVVPPQPG